MRICFRSALTADVLINPLERITDTTSMVRKKFWVVSGRPTHTMVGSPSHRCPRVANRLPCRSGKYLQGHGFLGGSSTLSSSSLATTLLGSLLTHTMITNACSRHEGGQTRRPMPGPAQIISNPFPAVNRPTLRICSLRSPPASVGRLSETCHRILPKHPPKLTGPSC